MPAWVDAFLRHRLKEGERWLCSFAFRDEALVGVLPVIIAPHPILGHRAPCLRTPFDEHTPSGDIVLAPAHTAAALDALLAQASRDVPDHVTIDLRAVRRNSTLWEAVRGRFREHRLHLGQQTLYSYLDVRGDFETYFASLGQLRKNLPRLRRKLEKRGTVSVEISTEAASTEKLFDEFLALEASGWKGRARTAILCDPKLVAFYRTLVRNFAEDGRLHWHTLRLDGRLIAAEMCIQCGDSLMQPKQAFDEELADCRPGHLLRGETLKAAFSRVDIAEFNPMSDAEAHRLWAMPRDEYIDVHLVRRGVLPMLLELPVLLQSVYQAHVRPRVPAAVKGYHRRLKAWKPPQPPWTGSRTPGDKR